jgi:transposase
MNNVIRIGVDTSKSVFQLHGVDAAEHPVLRKKLRRRDFLKFFEGLAPTKVGLEACGGSHHWGRELTALGHEVKLLPAQHVKPYVQRNKNDKRDAEAICEAMSRPRMSFVAVKTAERQAAQMLMGTRERLIAYRTQLTNTIRGYAAEFGLTAAKGLAHVEPLLARIAEDATVPELAKELFAIHGQEYIRLKSQLREIEAKLKAWHRQNEMSRRLGRSRRHRSDRRLSADGQGLRPAGLRLRPRLRGLDGVDPEGSLHCGQDAARRDYPCRRRGPASHPGVGRHLGDQAGQQGEG